MPQYCVGTHPPYYSVVILVIVDYIKKLKVNMVDQ